VNLCGHSLNLLRSSYIQNLVRDILTTKHHDNTYKDFTYDEITATLKKKHYINFVSLNTEIFSYEHISHEPNNVHIFIYYFK
jgi:hypothetical protein